MEKHVTEQLSSVVERAASGFVDGYVLFNTNRIITESLFQVSWPTVMLVRGSETAAWNFQFKVDICLPFNQCETAANCVHHGEMIKIRPDLIQTHNYASLLLI